MRGPHKMNNQIKMKPKLITFCIFFGYGIKLGMLSLFIGNGFSGQTLAVDRYLRGSEKKRK